jgi:HAD superfamily hydrolase (TIGR01490 family)
MKRAAFFDLDHTLVRVNSAGLYVRWRVRRGEMGMRDLAKTAWWTLLYKFGVLDAQRVGQTAVATLRDVDEAHFKDECTAWVLDEIMPHLSEHAEAEVARRREEGLECAMLTSSSLYVAEPIAAKLGIEHILCSRMEVNEGRFTGRLASPLCYGPIKVDVARQWAKDHEIDIASSAFYTDSVSDAPMLEVVGEPRVINPDPRLRMLARRRRWPVDSW